MSSAKESERPYLSDNESRARVLYQPAIMDWNKRFFD